MFLGRELLAVAMGENPLSDRGDAKDHCDHHCRQDDDSSDNRHRDDRIFWKHYNEKLN